MKRPPTGWELILTERLRHFEQENWSCAHDDNHRRCELRRAAECYLRPPVLRSNNYLTRRWPWDMKWWKPGPTRNRELEKAGALFLAEEGRQKRLGHHPTARRMHAFALRCARLIDRYP